MAVLKSRMLSPEYVQCLSVLNPFLEQPHIVSRHLVYQEYSTTIILYYTLNYYHNLLSTIWNILTPEHVHTVCEGSYGDRFRPTSVNVIMQLTTLVNHIGEPLW